MNYSSNNQNPLNLTPQQYNTLINMLSQSPQASTTSPQFDPNYFSKLSSLYNQQLAQKGYQIVRIVDDPSSIGPQEVSMGLYNVFPSSDRQKVYVKTWNNEGLIETNVYNLQNESGMNEGNKNEDDYFILLSQRIDKLEEKIGRLQREQYSLIKDKKTKTQRRTSQSKLSENDMENNNEMTNLEDKDDG